MKLVIDGKGTIKALYDDGLLGLGEVQEVTQAGELYWTKMGGWCVVLCGKQSGKLVVRHGFKTRTEAVAFEREWLEKNELK